MTAAYDFTTLSPEDFERLCSDLFSAEWGSQLEAFKAGPDGGIDLRHSRVLPGEKPVIVQCKRYAPNKYGELKRAMKNEMANLDKLKPERYVLATSTKLSNANKIELIELVWPHIAGTQDIYGPDELNGLLNKHEQIQKAHFKLWISSTAILERVLHARIFNATDATVGAVKEQMCRLVVHQGMERARNLLAEHNHCVIAGNPGIGKTTLARMLMCHYLQDGFTPLVVIGDVSDAWTVISESQGTTNKYVVLYDDFLGTLRFDEAKFSKNEDTSLMSFVEKVRRSTNLKFILTTREYVIADAQRLHGGFQQQADKLAKCTVLIEDYSRAIRAEVLFNHLFFSNLDEERLKLFVEQKIYTEIVGHDHFNPRVVETISNQANSATFSAEEFIEYVRKTFDDPSQLWAHPFEQQISPTAQQILVLVWSFGGTIELQTLRQALIDFASGSEPRTTIALRFRDAMKELTGNFLVCDRYNHVVREWDPVMIVQFQNPSVEEFIDRFLATEPSWSDALAANVTHYEQATRLQSWAQPVRSRSRRSAKVCTSRDFWPLLHGRTEVSESKAAGRLINYWHLGVAVYSSSSAASLIERTHTALKILENSRAKDDWAQRLLSRVVTLEGWRTLLDTVPAASSNCNDLKRLIVWLNSSEVVEPFLASCRATFAIALNEILATRDLSSLDLSDMQQLWNCFDQFQAPHRPQNEETMTALIISKAEALSEDEEDYQRLENAASTLNELAATFRIDPNLITRLECRASMIRDGLQDETASDDSTEYVSSEASEHFDVDALFASLLDR